MDITHYNWLAKFASTHTQSQQKAKKIKTFYNPVRIHMQYKYTDKKFHIDWSPEMIYRYSARTDGLPLLPAWFDFLFIISFGVFRNALGFVDQSSRALSWDPPIRKKTHHLQQNSHLKLNNSTYVEKTHHETISKLFTKPAQKEQHLGSLWVTHNWEFKKEKPYSLGCIKQLWNSQYKKLLVYV